MDPSLMLLVAKMGNRFDGKLFYILASITGVE